MDASRAHWQGSGSFCASINCRNSRKWMKNLHFFRFPRDPKRCNAWVNNVSREDLCGKTVDYLYNNCRVCQDHFDDSMFMNVKEKKKLIHNAVPTKMDVPNPPKLIGTKRQASKVRLSKIMKLDADIRPVSASHSMDSIPCPSQINTLERKNNFETHPDFVPSIFAGAENVTNESEEMTFDGKSKKKPKKFSRRGVAAPDTDPDTEITCLFHGCSSDKAKHPTLLFYKIPATGRRRQLWLKAINWPRRYCGAKIERVKNIQVDSQAVCCLHFITGQPSNDYTHPDFIPSVYPQIVTRSIKRQPPLHRDCEASSDREREAKRLWWYHVMASMVRTALRQADKTTEEHPPTDTNHPHDSTGDPKSPTQLDHTYSMATRFTQCHPKDIACLRRHLKCASTDTHDPDARLMAWLLNSDIPTITQECLEAILSFDHSRRQSLEPNYPLTIIPYMAMNMEAVHTHEQLASVICEMLSTYLTSNPSAQFPNREYCVTIEHIRTELGEPGMLLQRHAQEGLPECNVSPVIKTEPQCDDDDHHDHYHDDDHGDHHHDNDDDHDEEDADLSHFVIKEEVMDEDDCEQWRSSCGGDLSNMEVKQEVIDDYENSDLSRSNSEVCQWELKDGRLVLKYS